MKYFLYIIPFLIIFNAYANDPQVCPCASETNLIGLAQQSAKKANITTDYIKMGTFAQEGLFYSDTCLQKFPHSVGCHYYHAINQGLYIKAKGDNLKKRLKAMIAEFELVIKMNPYYDDGGAYVALGYVYLKAPSLSLITGGITRDLTKALNYAQNALKINAKNPHNLMLMGDILHKQKLKKKALKYYNKALANLDKINDSKAEQERLKKDLIKLVKKTK